MRIIQSTCLGILLVIVGGIAYWNLGWPWQYVEQKKALEAAAEEKYDADFKMKRMVFDRMHGGEYYGYLADQDLVEFYVGFENGELVDSYPFQKWETQMQRELNPIVQSFFHDAEVASVHVDSEDHLQDVGPEIPYYTEVVNVSLGASLPDVVVQDVEAELDRIWRVLNAIRGTSARVGSIHISYANKTFQAGKGEFTSREQLDGRLVDYAK